MTARRVILCMNSRSSSLKFALFQLMEAVETSLADGAVERIGLPGGHLRIHAATAAVVVDEPGDVPDDPTAVHDPWAAQEPLRLASPDPVRHHIVDSRNR